MLVTLMFRNLIKRPWKVKKRQLDDRRSRWQVPTVGTKVNKERFDSMCEGGDAKKVFTGAGPCECAAVIGEER